MSDLAWIYVALIVVLALIGVLVYFMFFAAGPNIKNNSNGNLGSSADGLRYEPCLTAPVEGCANATYAGAVIAAGHWNGDTSKDCWKVLNEYSQRDNRGLYYLSLQGSLVSAGQTYFYLDLGDNKCGPLIYVFDGNYGCPAPLDMGCQSSSSPGLSSSSLI